jgi:hypothetical protein
MKDTEDKVPEESPTVPTTRRSAMNVTSFRFLYAFGGLRNGVRGKRNISESRISSREQIQGEGYMRRENRFRSSTTQR